MEDNKYCYKYPHPAVTADNVVFCLHNQEIYTLLVKRKNPPYQNNWAFPGGFMEIDEDIEQCAKRELQEETGITIDKTEQLQCFSCVNRDPRERVISVAFISVVEMQQVCGGDDASQACWIKLSDLPDLAFDHGYMLDVALERLQEKLGSKTYYKNFFNTELDDSQLQVMYNAVCTIRNARKNNFSE